MRRPCTGTFAFALIALVATPATALATHTPSHQTIVGSFSSAPASPIVNEVVTFTSTATALGQNNRIDSQDWDLDNDGAFDDATGTTASRAFSPAGTYTVRLRVIDRFDNEAVVVQSVIVRDPPPTPLLSPFPLVQMAGRVTGNGTRVRVSVRSPIGATVTVECVGRGCPLRRQTRTAKARPRSTAAVTTLIRLGRFARRALRVGVLLRVYVTKPGTIGKYARFEMRRNKPPARTDRCALSDTTPPIACPPA